MAVKYIKLGSQAEIFIAEDLGIYLNKHNAAEVKDVILLNRLRNFILTGYLVEIKKVQFDNIRLQSPNTRNAPLSVTRLASENYLNPAETAGNTPVVASAIGQRFLVGTNPTGSWANYKDYIAVWNGNNWDFIIPEDGNILPIYSSGVAFKYHGTYPSGYWEIPDNSLLTVDEAAGDEDSREYALRLFQTEAIARANADNVLNQAIVDSYEADIRATRVKVADVNGYYSNTDVETILQEIGSDFEQIGKDYLTKAKGDAYYLPINYIPDIDSEIIISGLGYIPYDSANPMGYLNSDTLDALGIWAKLDSPIFIGTPTTPTPDYSDVSLKIANTAFINYQILNHTHLIADTIGLQAALDGKAALVHTHIIDDVTGLQTALNARELLSNKNIAGGYAGLDGSGLVHSYLLPSYVDDVLEVANYGALPVTGEQGKIYVVLAAGTDPNDSQPFPANSQFRWTGTTYAKIIASPGTTDNVVEGVVNLYYTDTRVQTFSDTRYSLLGHTHSFASITSKPTTLSGYGITDAYPLTGNPSGFLTSFTETDPIYTASSWYTTTNNAANWNTAYSQSHTHANKAFLDTITSGATIALNITGNAATATLAANSTLWNGQAYSASDSAVSTYMLTYKGSNTWGLSSVSHIQSFLGITGGPFLPLTAGSSKVLTDTLWANYGVHIAYTSSGTFANPFYESLVRYGHPSGYYSGIEGGNTYINTLGTNLRFYVHSGGGRINAYTIDQSGNNNWTGSGTFAGALQGTSVSATDSMYIRYNSFYLYGRNVTDTAYIPMIGLDGSNIIRIGSSGNAVNLYGLLTGTNAQFNSNLIMLGAGSGNITLYSSYSGSPASPGMTINNYAGANTFYHNANGGVTYSLGSFATEANVTATGHGLFGASKVGNWSYDGNYTRFGHSSFDGITNYGFLQHSTGSVFIGGTSVSLKNLEGSGDRFVVTNEGGTLITATIGSGLSYSGGVLSATGGATGTVTGTGTAGYIARWNSASDIGNSVITESSSKIGINTAPSYRLHVIETIADWAAHFEGTGGYGVLGSGATFAGYFQGPVYATTTILALSTITGSSFTGAGTGLTGTAASLTAGAIQNQANSATISASTGVGASTIAQRDASGYLWAVYFNADGNRNAPSSSGLNTIVGHEATSGYFYDYNATAVAAFLGLGSAAYTVSTDYYASGSTVVNSTQWNGYTVNLASYITPEHLLAWQGGFFGPVSPSGLATFISGQTFNTLGNAATATGQSFVYSNSSNSPTYIWATNANGSAFLASRAAMSVSYADSAGSATLASTVTINYNNDSATTYQMLWGSGNGVYGTAGVYVNPSIDVIYAAYFSETSSRASKRNIEVFKEDALSIIRNTSIQQFYKNKGDKQRLVGFIAEDTSPWLSGNNQDQMLHTNVMGISMRAIQQLDHKFESLETKLKKEIESLKERIKILESCQE